MSIPAPQLKTHDLRDLIINFGIVNIEGFGVNDVLTIRRTNPNFTSVLGLHGSVAPIMSKDQRAIADITVMRESGNNISLSIISALDSLSGFGVFPFLVRYANLTNLYASVLSRVIHEPDVVFSSKNGFLTWRFELYRLRRLG